MRVAVDTNILVYAAGFDDEPRQQGAVACLQAISEGHSRHAATQVLGELYRVLTRKFRLPAAFAANKVNSVRLVSVCTPTDDFVFDSALELAEAHHFDIWDAIILAAAAEARCDILLSEDMRNGFNWRGVTVIDPFAKDLHPLAVHLLGRR